MKIPAITSFSNEYRRGKKTPPTLVAFVGTAYLNLTEYLALLPNNSIVLAIDVPDELAQLQIRLVEGRILQIVPLGAGQTARQLIQQHGSLAQIACLSLFNSTSADGGMSQLSGCGGAATRSLIESSDFVRFIKDDVIPLLNTMADGSLAKVNFHSYQGASGGAGSEGGCVLYDELISTMLKQTGATIDCSCHLLGAATFASPGFPRTKYNASASATRWTKRALNHPSDRVTTTLYCHELNPVGTNKFLRDSLLIEQHIALESTQVVEYQERVHSNHSVSGPLGNLRFIRTDHFHPLPPERIASDAARSYLPLLTGISTCRPDTELVDDFRWEVWTTPLPQESVESILERTLTTPLEELLASLTASPATWESIPVVNLCDGRQLPLKDIQAVFGSPLSTLTDLGKRIQLLLTCLVIVRQVREDIEGDLADSYAVQEQLLKHAAKNICSIQSVSFLSKLKSGASKIKRAAEAFDQLREKSDRTWETESKNASIALAQRMLDEEMANLLEKIMRVKKLLSNVLPKGDKLHLKPCMKPLPIDSLLPQLFQLAEADDASVSQTIHLLAQGVKYVTPAGLAEITGAVDDTLEAIVRSACKSEFFLEGPAWGGLPRQQGQVDRFLVYPPVNPAMAENLKMIHKNNEEGHRVAFARSALGSINIIQLDITYGKTTADLLNKSYLRGLRQALESPLRPLFLDNADELLAELGITQDDLNTESDVS